jgi:hypothetical protein
MRTVHWLFLVSVALFVSGIGFIVAAAQTPRQAPAAASAIDLTPVASVKQIMQGIVTPAARTVFRSVGTIVSGAGIEENAPQTDEEWQTIGNSAAALVESGNLLLLGNRAVDKGEWVTMTQAMIEAGQAALRATEEKNAQKIFELGEAINESCDNCHQKYQRGS